MTDKSLRLFLLLLLAAPVCLGDEYKPPTGPDKFAHVVYDAVGNVELDEGTVELWVRNDFDPQSNLSNRFYMPMCYFRLSNGPKGDARIGLIARHSTSSKDVFATVDGASGGEKLQRLGWQKRGEWHHLAMTWRFGNGQYRRKLYVDGKLADKCVSDRPLMVLHEEAQVYVGACYFNCCFAAVDQLRISAVERTEQEIKDSAEKGMTWDRLTLLFDDFGNIETGPDKSATTRSEKGKVGTVKGAYKLIDGRFGKALQLHVVEEEIP